MTAMGWFITADVGEFLTEAGEFLRAEPAPPSRVVLTVTGEPPGSPRPAQRPGLDAAAVRLLDSRIRIIAVAASS